jgi:hypothetical protein
MSSFGYKNNFKNKFLNLNRWVNIQLGRSRDLFELQLPGLDFATSHIILFIINISATYVCEYHLAESV